MKLTKKRWNYNKSICGPSFDDEDVIEGQGNFALEVLDELPDANILLVPVGGGGIVSGIAARN